MKNYLVLLLVLIISKNLCAQTDFRDGYIITLTGDTVIGSIRFRDDHQNSLKCSFKDKEGRVSEYLPGEIESYRFVNGKYYISKYIKDKDSVLKVFAEYLVKGQKNLFYYRDIKGYHFLIDYTRDTLIGLPYHREIISNQGVLYEKESKQHIGYLKKYFEDCPVLFPKIEKIRSPDFGNLVPLTKEYHDLTCPDSTCVVFYKPKYRLKIAVEPYFTSMNVRRIFLGNAVSTNQTGAMLYFWLPKASERLFLKTGFLYSKITDEFNYSMLKIPIQLEYQFLDRGFRPKLDLGFNYYSIQYYSIQDEGKGLCLSSSAGVLIRLLKFAYLDLAVSTDLLNMTLDPHLFISRSFETGIFISF